jgi:epoxyqueuosine reductase
VSPTERALELARLTGFDLAGVTPFRAPRDAARLREWIAAGRNAGLAYLERDLERIANPAAWDPAGKSMLIVGLAHSRAGFELPGGGKVARYAAGRDYHNVLLRKLRKLRKLLTAEGLIARETWSRVGVDAVPLLERSHAAEAGLGFTSKAANLLHPTFGPWFFLGELVLDLELDPTPTPPAGSCGTCRACLDACPTQAILAPGVVDARRCISYHTIENDGPAPRELRASFGEWAFGCDVCSEVCPWGSKAPARARERRAGVARIRGLGAAASAARGPRPERGDRARQPAGTRRRPEPAERAVLRSGGDGARSRRVGPGADAGIGPAGALRHGARRSPRERQRRARADASLPRRRALTARIPRAPTGPEPAPPRRVAQGSRASRPRDIGPECVDISRHGLKRRSTASRSARRTAGAAVPAGPRE